MTTRSRGRHARPPRSPRGLLRAAVVASSAGALLGALPAAASAEQAAGKPPPADALGGAASGLEAGVAGVVGPVKRLRLNPLARTGVDPLDNTLGTSIADFPPVTTGLLTGPLASGASLAELPGVGDLVRHLPG
ncbi:hypothetical protein GCM10027168_35060 [Streptomyces capparidis]